MGLDNIPGARSSNLVMPKVYTIVGGHEQKKNRRSLHNDVYREK
jgi:hypothetical protein